MSVPDAMQAATRATVTGAARFPTSLAARLREPGSPAHAALLRVLLGLHVLLVLQSPSLTLLIAIEPQLHPQSHVLGGAALYESLPPWLIGHTRLVGSIAAACVIAGLGGRLATGLLLVCFLVTQLYWFGATLFHDDWIYFTFPLIALVTVTQPTAFSLDDLLARVRGRPCDLDVQTREARFLVEAWVFWIGFVYMAAGVAKVFPLAKGALWLSGIAAQEFAIEFVQQSPAVALFGSTPFPYDQRWIFALGAVATVLVELGAGLLWLTRRAYLPLALAIFALHLGIWMVGIPGFIGMFSVLAAALLPGTGFSKLDGIHRRDRQPSR